MYFSAQKKLRAWAHPLFRSTFVRAYVPSLFDGVRYAFNLLLIKPEYEWTFHTSCSLPLPT